MSSLGNRIKTMRQSRGMTQLDLADVLGVSRSAVAMWEKDEREPNLETIEAIADVFNVSLSSLVEKDPSALPYGLLRIKKQRIPLLGEISAGVPIFADEDFNAYVDADAELHADFALKVKGDSMNPVYENGDVVFIRQQPDVRDGQVAAVGIDDEATLKCVYHVRGGIQLLSYNTSYPPMLYTKENSDVITIFGLAVGYFRRTAK